MFLVTKRPPFCFPRKIIFPWSFPSFPQAFGAVRFNMAAVEGSLEEEALKRRERLKAMRKKSGLADEQVSEMHDIFC